MMRALGHSPVRGIGNTLRLLGACIAVLGAAGCGDDDIMTPLPETTFTLRIENVSQAYSLSKSGVFSVPVGSGQAGPIGPGGAYEFSFSAPPGSWLSFATMFVPSNDFFYAPDETGIALFNPANGSPVSGDVTAQVSLWDAGTEINQEPGLGGDQVQRQMGANTGAADPNNSVRTAPDDFNNLPATGDVLRVTIVSSQSKTGMNGTEVTANTQFTVRIENVSSGTTLGTSDSMTQAVPLSPGAWAVHTTSGPLFSIGQPDRDIGLEGIAEDGDTTAMGSYLSGVTGLTVPLSPGVWALHSDPDPLFTALMADRGDGLEAIAEDGNPGQLAAALDADASILESAIFNTPVGSMGAGPIGPGGAYEVTFDAGNSDRLSFATMFVESNDLFYAPNGSGIALFEANGDPITGDVTSQVQLWDAGTEVNEEPGVGTNQVKFQAAANTGPAENGTVREISQVSDGYTYPSTASVIRVTITPNP